MYSNEQLIIAKKLIDENYNVRVKAVAGSGKTTTIKHISERTCENILVLLYNKKLADESREKLLDGKILNNIKIVTIHSLSQELYGIICKTDEGLYEILEKKIKIKYKYLFKYLIIDEAQDLTSLMIDIINKIIIDCNLAHLRLCILGDEKQCIYKYKGANEKYLIETEKYIQNIGAWIDCSLKTTYRLTKEMTEFINNCIINEKDFQMISNKKGIQPYYIYTNIYCDEHYKYIYKIINEKINKGYQYSDIAIITFSLKNTFIKKLVNYLSMTHIPIYVSNRSNDINDYGDNKTHNGKLYISTIHKMKGRQRKIIIYYGFDNGIFDFYCQDLDSNKCQNIMYVALTRAEEELICIHHNQKKSLKFLNNLKDYVNFIEIKSNFKLPNKIENEYKIISIHELIDSLDINKIKYYKNLLNIEVLNQPETDIIQNTIINFTKGCEDVSAIYGTAIPLYFNYTRNNNSLTYMYNKISKIYNDNRYNIHARNISAGERNIYQEIAYGSNIINCLNSGYYHLLNQIDNYNWVDENIIEKATSRCTLLPKKGVFEKILSYKINNNIYISGAIDFISNDKHPTIWEMKFTSELESIHILQVALYIALYYRVHNKLLSARLFNIRTKEIYSINLPKDKCNFLLFDIYYNYIFMQKNFFSNKIDFDESFPYDLLLINKDDQHFERLSRFFYHLDHFKKIKCIDHSKEYFFNIMVNNLYNSKEYFDFYDIYMNDF